MKDVKRLLPPAKIGILGGGQLGRMMALSAREMGYRIAVMEPAADSPCGMIADDEIVSGYDDQNGAAELAKVCDVLTYEFENITAETAAYLEEHMYLPQGSELLKISQDRLKEKETVQSFGIPAAPWEAVCTYAGLKDAVASIGLPGVLKTTRGGYDGKGQAVIQTESDLHTAWEELKEAAPLVLEKKIAFDLELSVIMTRSTSGEMSVFPIAENEHRNGILHRTIVPARISDNLAEKAEMLARRLAESLELTGTLAVEMFAKGEQLYVNEIAPRPHNSGHFSINACETSQFEQHIRAVCGLPLGNTDLLKPAVMVNLLGQHLQPCLDELDQLPAGHLHVYGKKEAKYNRKMGHITFLTDDPEALLHELDESPVWKEAATGGTKR
ncbi:5-(carboxyamino)imidazole ribonucleotide synthase [Bacillus daqingensis]|uniref:N5-carboxyaminoimidazole ribonucleotide synthase n=1 Tax=Bacillus daqingensis TaxID=872396 RepID=A0ABV9NWG7_9BACI